MPAAAPLLFAAIMGVVEGLTEFLPVSSTGHLVLVGELLGHRSEADKAFEIFIQLGAILAVVWESRAVLLPGERFSLRSILLSGLAFCPAAVLGLLFHHVIKEHLFHGRVVAWSLVLGAVGIWIIESLHPKPRVESLGKLGVGQAVGVGFWQCLALVPGVSRAGATILGGMLLGLSRPVATEFSFLLAVPTMGAATLYDLYKSRALLSSSDLPMFATGFVVSFLVALLVIRWLVGYVRQHDFRPFAIWRIALGAAVLLFWPK